VARQDWGILIVGLGGISHQHLEGYRRQGLKVVAGADPDEARRQAAKARFNIPLVGPDFREFLNHPDVRIVDIAVPHIMDIRQPIVDAAAQAGKAIFIQKPLAPYLADARKLVETAERYNVPMMVNQNSVFVPAFTAIEPYLRDEKWIGKPYYFEINNRGWMYLGPESWYGKDKRWVVSDMAVHHFALVRHWFGDAKTVYAIMKRDESQEAVRGDTLGAVSITFESGVAGLVINNWSYRGDRTRMHSLEEILIQGTKGAITGDSSSMCVATLHPQPCRIYPEVRGSWFPDAFGHAMVHFIDALESGRPFLCEARDNLKTIAIIEAAYRSAEEGRAVDIAEVMQ
jgi:predicted dehydrogenase